MQRKVKAVLLVILFSLAASVNILCAEGPNSGASFPTLPQFARFQQIGLDQGLSHGTAWHLMRDRRGYIWIATFDGLNRFDAYNVTVFKHDPENSNSLSSSFIRHVYETEDGLIWVSTNNGFNKFNPETNRFTRYFFDVEAPDKTASVMFEDSAGRLWVGTWHGTLYQFDRSSERLVAYKPPKSQMKLGRIFHIIEDTNGLLWLAIDGSFTCFDPQTGNFKHYTHDSGNPHSLSHNKVIDIKVDGQGKFWIATVGGGINRFDPATESFTHYRHNPDDPSSLSSDAVMVLNRKNLVYSGSAPSAAV